MNPLERRMLNILKEGREKNAFLSVKAEFEAEGTRTQELLRLLEIARRAQVGVAIKIGGCEAIRDLLECKQFGIDYIIAPMIETPYALSKYIDAKNKVFSADERRGIKFLFNLETISAYNQIDQLVKEAKRANGADGIVFGRADFAGSLGKTKEFIESDEMTNYVVNVAKHCKAAGLELVTGGKLTYASTPGLRKIRSVALDRFETRKIVLSSNVLDQENLEQAINLAGEFELLWLENKRNYYQSIGEEDEERIAMLLKRFPAQAARAA